jgi:aldehyde dehydrogenase (NAD+)
MWHVDRLLVDGQPAGTQADATYETIAPATGDVLGTAADASVADADRPIAAAWRAFDTTSWSRDHAERVRWFRGPDAPFGGYKQSRIGREMGAAGLDEFLERKTFAEPAP